MIAGQAVSAIWVQCEGALPSSAQGAVRLQREAGAVSTCQQFTCNIAGRRGIRHHDLPAQLLVRVALVVQCIGNRPDHGASKGSPMLMAPTHQPVKQRA